MDRTKLKRYGIGAATFATALTIGFVLQYGDAVASRVSGQAPSPDVISTTPEAEAVVAPATASVLPPSATPATTLSGAPSIASPYGETAEVASPAADIGTDAPILELAAADIVDDLTMPSTSVDAEIVTPSRNGGQGCDLRMLATASDMAMVDLTMDAPCQAEASFVVYHQGMSISGQTDDLGLAQMSIPALNEHALFIVTFADGESTMAQSFVPDMKEFDRAVLQWTGTHGFELHALRDNASYGQDGHIWSGSDGSAETGAVVSFTSGEHAAEIYTYPAGQTSNISNIQLNVEAAIKTENCGQVISAQAIQIGPNRTTGITDLEMTLPNCNAIGEILVLKNIYEDLTFAAK